MIAFKTVDLPRVANSPSPSRRHSLVALAASVAIHGAAAAVIVKVPIELGADAGEERGGAVTVWWAEPAPRPKEREAASIPWEAYRRASEVPGVARRAGEAVGQEDSFFAGRARPDADRPAVVAPPATFAAALAFSGSESAAPAPVPAVPEARSQKQGTSVKRPVEAEAVAARPLRAPAPDYPAAAREGRVEGTVLFEADIDAGGRLTALRLVETSGSAVLDAAAGNALRRWTFAPATRGGVAVPSRMRVPFAFRLE